MTNELLALIGIALVLGLPLAYWVYYMSFVRHRMSFVRHRLAHRYPDDVPRRIPRIKYPYQRRGLWGRTP